MIFYTGSATAPVVVGEIKNGQQKVSVRQDGISHNLLKTPAQTDEFIKERNAIENKRTKFNRATAGGLTIAGGIIGYVSGGKSSKAIATGVGAIIGLLTSTAVATVSTLIANHHQNNITQKFIAQNNK